MDGAVVSASEHRGLCTGQGGRWNAVNNSILEWTTDAIDRRDRGTCYP
jgi:hypothetical protein